MGWAQRAVGSYMAVYIPLALPAAWNWRDYGLNTNSEQAARRDDPTAMIPCNYLVFSVSRYQAGGA